LFEILSFQLHLVLPMASWDMARSLGWSVVRTHLIFLSPNFFRTHRIKTSIAMRDLTISWWIESKIAPKE
jgi:hypothetical protein